MNKIVDTLSKPIYSMYERRLEKEVIESDVPQHIAIIMDGNRRYAKEQMLEGINSGHMLGEAKIEEMLDWCLHLRIKYVTIYAFSVENFKRDGFEIEYLMALAEASLYRISDDPRIHANKVRVNVIGDRESLPEPVREAIAYADERTSMYSDFVFNVALAYGGRQEILGAIKSLASKVKAGDLEIENINESMVAQHLYTGNIPDPDLVLRTSGEVRISNFLLWQMAYSELYFTDVYWPGFRYIDMLRAIRTYQQRVRRYGE